MAISGTDLALTTCRLGAARVGAFRLGFAPCFVKGVGAVEPGEYGWDEIQPPTTQWTLLNEDCVCGKRPVASFTDVPDPSDEGESVQFTDTSTPTGEITYWAWDFGDGGTSTDQNPTYTYATAGTYTVTLNIASANGTDQASGSHTVNAAGSNITGTVTYDEWPYGAPPGPVWPSCEVSLDLDGVPWAGGTETTDANGVYTFTNVPAATLATVTIVNPQIPPGEAQAFNDTNSAAHDGINETTIDLYATTGGA